jgi:hypothetical protein
MPLVRLIVSLICFVPVWAMAADGNEPELYPARQAGKYGFIDASGRMVLPAKYDFALPFSDGLAQVHIGVVHALIDRSGKVVASPLPPQVWPCAEGRCQFADEHDRTGYLDTAGKVAIAPTFDAGETFSEGLVAVRSGDVWGYIDKSGAFVIAAAFAFAGEFNCGVAFVRKDEDGLIGAIDRSGRIVIEAQFDDVNHFQETAQGCLASVAKGTKWGYLRTNGQFAIAPQFDEAGEFSENLAFVQFGEKSRYIHSEGRTAFELPRGVTHGSRFSEGMARIEVDGSKSGFVAKDGRVAIKPAYDSAGDFHGELARVKLGGKSGYIDRNGKFRWPLSN